MYLTLFTVLSAMIRGADDGGNKFSVKDYKEEDLDEIFRTFFQE